MAGAGSNRRDGRGRGGRKVTRAGSGSSPGPNGSVAGVVKATIPSDYNAGREVQERILQDVERHGYSNDTAFAIRIALEEALVNAIKHGNRLDPSKKVHVESRVTPKRAEITIEDEGPGFDRASVPDPTLEENLDKCSGRGILLMEAYMNRVEWSRGGRRVHMVKKNEADLLPR